MSKYSTVNEKVQTVSDDLMIVVKDKHCKRFFDNIKKNFSHPVVKFNNPEDELNFKERNFIMPETWFSPKDKISNRIWGDKLPIGENTGIITAHKMGDSGCIVQLDYEKIINSDDVITGAQLSNFDRCVYDAVVTLHVAGNDIFSTTNIWRIISQNSKSELTPSNRDKIIKSMFHISRFWMSIVTDDSEKSDTWDSLNQDKIFKPERKIYKNLQTVYTGRLLDFRVIGRITFDVSYSYDGKEYHEKEEFAEVWKLGFPPILYQYAHAKNQVSAVPIKYLDTSRKTDKKIALKRGDRTDELASFLAREIDTMIKTAKRKQPYSRIILLERIYKIDGIDDIQQGDANGINKKKSRTRDKLIKILNRFKENDMIKGHSFQKKTVGKSLTFHSVEIFF